jgi:hypothetical protein
MVSMPKIGTKNLLNANLEHYCYTNLLSELKRMWKQAAMILFWILSQNLAGKTEGKHYDSKFPG